jgi:hypothetical protein
MNYKRIVIMIITVIVIIISCKKEETSITVSKENSVSDLQGNNTEMPLVAVRSSASGFEYIELIGHSEINNPDCKYFAITIYASSITNRTYTVPEYNPGYIYDNTSGYALAYYSKTPSSEVTDWYSSQYIQGAGGSVTISGMSGDRVRGSYDLTLVSFRDRSKTLSLKGNFEANIASTDN